MIFCDITRLESTMVFQMFLKLFIFYWEFSIIAYFMRILDLSGGILEEVRLLQIWTSIPMAYSFFYYYVKSLAISILLIRQKKLQGNFFTCQNLMNSTCFHFKISNQRNKLNTSTIKKLIILESLIRMILDLLKVNIKQILFKYINFHIFILIFILCISLLTSH